MGFLTSRHGKTPKLSPSKAVIDIVLFYYVYSGAPVHTQSNFCFKLALNNIQL